MTIVKREFTVTYFMSPLCEFDRKGAERAGLADCFDSVVAEEEDNTIETKILGKAFDQLLMALWTFRGNRLLEQLKG